jgi:hypothetical protein
MPSEKKKKFERILNYSIGFLCNISNNEIIIESLFKYTFEILLTDLLKLDQIMNIKIWQILSNMSSSSSDAYTQLLLETGVSECILQIISKDLKDLNPKCLKEVIFLTSNISAGSISQVNRLIKCGIINKIININVELKNLDLCDKENLDYLKVRKNFKLFIYFY